MEKHFHIYSFCGEPGCRDTPYHPNTENLVSMPLNGTDVGAYFAEALSEDEYAVVICAGDCVNPAGPWLYIPRDEELMHVFRPQHYTLETADYSDHTWAKQRVIYHDPRSASQ